MRKNILVFLVVLSLNGVLRGEEITIGDVVKKVSKNNYQVLSEALRVYQAKQSISVARAELLPSLNIWKIASAAADPTSLISPDTAPFLVPSNWFRLAEAKRLYLAEKEGYRALWANQVFISKALYLQVLSDQNLLTMIQNIRKNLGELEVIARKRELLGGLKPGIARELRIKGLSLDDDVLRLARLVEEEYQSLVYNLGLEVGTKISLAPVQLPDLLSVKKLVDIDLIWRAISVSPERTQHLHILDALKYVKHEVWYSFLGLGSNSRGVGGGIFDSMPIPSGLGFATAPSLRIVEAERQRFVIQLKGIEETVKRDLSSMVSLFNLEVDAFPNLIERADLASEVMVNLKDRLTFGEDLDLVLLGEGYKGFVTAQSSLSQAQFRFLMFKERLMRLTFNEDYQLMPAVLEEIE
jgi:hypothetical protein